MVQVTKRRLICGNKIGFSTDILSTAVYYAWICCAGVITSTQHLFFLNLANTLPKKESGRKLQHFQTDCIWFSKKIYWDLVIDLWCKQVCFWKIAHQVKLWYKRGSNFQSFESKWFRDSESSIYLYFYLYKNCILCAAHF